MLTRRQKQQQDHDKLLLWENQLKTQLEKGELPGLYPQNGTYILSDRLVLVHRPEESDEYWNLMIFDLLTTEKRPVRFRRSTDEDFDPCVIYLVHDEFFLVIEHRGETEIINIFKFDWDKDEVPELIGHFEETHWMSWILIDKMDPSKFILKYVQRRAPGFNYQTYKVSEEGKIELENEPYQSEDHYNKYSSDKLINVNKFRLSIYDLITKTNQTVKIDGSLVGNVELIFDVYECFNNKVYVKVNFEDKEIWGVAWANLETKQWSLLNLKSNFEIWKLRISEDKLIAFSLKGTKMKSRYTCAAKFFDVPVKRPNHLRYSAWLLVVKIMKKRKEKDPYLAAKEYLPLNSDLQNSWYKHVETNNEEKNDKENQDKPTTSKERKRKIHSNEKSGNNDENVKTKRPKKNQ